MNEARSWRLYIDESGNFGGDSDVVVAGVLVDVKVEEMGTLALSEALQFEARGVPWPLHACVVRRPSVLALAHHLVDVPSKRQSLPSVPEADAADRLLAACFSYTDVNEWLALLDPVRAGLKQHWRTKGLNKILAKRTELRRAASLLLARCPKLAGRVLEALRRRSDPTYEDIRALESELAKRDPSLFASLEDRVRDLDAAYRAVIRTLAEAESSSNLYLFFAGESNRGDHRPPNQADRYLSLLEAMSQRAVAALERLPGTHRLEVTPLERKVRENPRGPLLSLRASHRVVQDLLRRVGESSSANVSVVAGPVVPWRRPLALPYVLADYSANRALPIVGSRGALGSLGAKLRIALGPYHCSGDPTRSHLAAAGKAHAYLMGDTDGPHRFDWTGAWGWAKEQATEWRA